MEPTVRLARPDDLPAVAAFTQGTFAWGDYVSEAFSDWLDDETGRLLVGTDPDDQPIALLRVAMLSDREAWLHAARVHPDHRRGGMGSLLNRAGCDWAQQQGALVVRLLVEDWNQPAANQVQRLGFRPIARFVHAVVRLTPEMGPAANGGRRVTGDERLIPGRRTETELAWIAWSGSALAVAGHELFPVGWHFRRMTLADLRTAVESSNLWQSPAGWVIAEPRESEMSVPFVSTTDLDSSRMVRAILDLAARRGAERLQLMSPNLGWMIASLQAVGFEIEPNTVFARNL